MCGIVGFWSKVSQDSGVVLEKMVDQLAHRGPDDFGKWIDREAGLALGHRRLSVIDLSPAGHQPMISASGRYVIAYNGEIYNHASLREELEKRGEVDEWRGHSDTESLLAAIESWGPDKAVRACTGMFAFALWDRQTRQLLLGRDRIGEKPLYYGVQGNSLIFGSELKALTAHPDFRTGVDKGALALLLRYGAVPAPYSIYKHIWKLPPGSWISFDLGEGLSAALNSRPVRYWELSNVITKATGDPFAGSGEDAVNELEAVLGNSVQQQMLSDVPLGAFLSGGIDSSTVVALMQKCSSRPVKTFTIGFCEREYSEAGPARDVADHLRTDHTEMIVRPEDALSVIPSLPDIYCEPFGDVSQIPTFLVSRLARQHVTVALSGDGGDELFGGYNRHFLVPSMWRRIRWLPLAVRQRLAILLLENNEASLDKIYTIVQRALPSRFRVTMPGYKLHKFARVLDQPSAEMLHRAVISVWSRPSEAALIAEEPETLFDKCGDWFEGLELEHRIMAMDTLTYLPDDILVKVDRAAMAVSLETRLPMLNHDVMAYAWSLPLSMKIQSGVGKTILRRLLHRYVPSELVDRPKQGFEVPIDQWLRGPLREWAETLLDARGLSDDGYFDPTAVRTMWDEHVSGLKNHQYRIWILLMFQAWLQRQRQRTSFS